MRAILKKIERQQLITEGEYSQLIQYAEELRLQSPESFLLFYDRYATILFRNYNTYLPRFTYGIDYLYDYLLNNPQLIEYMPGNNLPIDLFPYELQDYLAYTYGDEIKSSSLAQLISLINSYNEGSISLPQPRRKEPVIKYENANYAKEPGLKSHFERLARYSFVSRIQSYRYLRNNKARVDRIDVVADDCLGGIFTNKTKSIYYYIFLTENNMSKTINACRVLNIDLYDRNSGEIKNAEYNQEI